MAEKGKRVIQLLDVNLSKIDNAKKMVRVSQEENTLRELLSIVESLGQKLNATASKLQGLQSGRVALNESATLAQELQSLDETCNDIISMLQTNATQHDAKLRQTNPATTQLFHHAPPSDNLPTFPMSIKARRDPVQGNQETEQPATETTFAY